MGKVLISQKDVEKCFEKGELIPAVVQDAENGDVLMLAYMNRQSLEKTFESGYTWFYSRSRKELWNKGATSGHIQKITEIYADCDFDTLLVKVHQTGTCLPYGKPQLLFYQNLRKRHK